MHFFGTSSSYILIQTGCLSVTEVLGVREGEAGETSDLSVTGFWGVGEAGVTGLGNKVEGSARTGDQHEMRGNWHRTGS
jgi:hypothetical protein